MNYCIGKTYRGTPCPYRAVGDGDKCGIHANHFTKDIPKVLPFLFDKK